MEMKVTLLLQRVGIREAESRIVLSSQTHCTCCYYFVAFIIISRGDLLLLPKEKKKDEEK